MRQEKFVMRTGMILLVMLVMVTCVTIKPVSATTICEPVPLPCVPPGALIDSATFSIYVSSAAGQTVNLHRITAPWVETLVTWNNFGGAFDVAVEGLFIADSVGWHSVDVTALVQE